MPYKDPIKAKEFAKQYREANKEKHKVYQKEYRKSQAEKLALYKHNWYKTKRGDKLQKTYGISLETFYTMLTKQEYKCKICSIEFTESIRPYIDHCHTHGQVRGLICFHCNTGLGHFKDNPKILMKAARYLYDN